MVIGKDVTAFGLDIRNENAGVISGIKVLVNKELT